MIGVNKTTGKHLSGIAHLQQSIHDIVGTPIGSRVMLREYGCRVHDYLDRAMNGETKLLIYSAIAEALRRWEPRFALKRVQLTRIESGFSAFLIEGESLENGENFTAEVQV